MKNLILSALFAFATLVFGALSAQAACTSCSANSCPLNVSPACPISTHDCCCESPMSVLSKEEKFSTFVSLLQKTGLDTVLETEGPFTIFAPTNEALAKAGICAIQDVNKLKKALLYHIVPCDLGISEIREMANLDTLEGDRLSVNVKDGWFYVDEARIIDTDMCFKNGMIHGIDSIVYPEA